MRSIFLLANAFNGYCNNRKDETEYSYYPMHGEHHEEAVSISSGRDNPPHESMLFRVSSRNPELAEDAKKSGELVRDGRAKERTRDTGNFYQGSEDPDENRDSFVSAPIAYPVKEVYEGHFTEQEWAEITKINWEFLNNINIVNSEEVDMLKISFELTEKNPDLNLKPSVFTKLLIGVRKLMRTIKILYQDQEMRNLIAQGKIVLFPALCDKNGRFRAIIPLIKKGQNGSNGSNGNGEKMAA